jgi:hypothetical protein
MEGIAKNTGQDRGKKEGEIKRRIEGRRVKGTEEAVREN